MLTRDLFAVANLPVCVCFSVPNGDIGVFFGFLHFLGSAPIYVLTFSQFLFFF